MERLPGRVEGNRYFRSQREVTGVTKQAAVHNALFGVHVNGVLSTWSPGSGQILIPSERNGKQEFFVMNPDGSFVRQRLKNSYDPVKLRFVLEDELVRDWSP